MTATASAWKKAGMESAEVIDLALPSGVTIRARRPEPAQLAEWQRRPAPLTAAVAGAAAASNGEGALAQLQFFRELLEWCCVSPRISLDPQSDAEIHPRDVSQKDWVYIVRWALREEEARALQSFRDVTGYGRGGVDGGGVAGAAVGTDGDRG